MKFFNSHALYLSIVFQKPFKVKLDFPLSAVLWNNEERLRGRIECQSFLEFGGSMVNVVYMDEVGL